MMKFYSYSATQQRWSPWSRGHILKSLASKPQVLEKCLSSARGQQYFLNGLNFVVCQKKILKTFVFGDRLHLDCKTDSICVKTDQNLGQDRLM